MRTALRSLAVVAISGACLSAQAVTLLDTFDSQDFDNSSGLSLFDGGSGYASSSSTRGIQATGGNPGGQYVTAVGCYAFPNFTARHVADFVYTLATYTPTSDPNTHVQMSIDHKFISTTGGASNWYFSCYQNSTIFLGSAQDIAGDWVTTSAANLTAASFTDLGGGHPNFNLGNAPVAFGFAIDMTTTNSVAPGFKTNINFDNFSFSTGLVTPEPWSFAPLGLGVLALAHRKRRRL